MESGIQESSDWTHPHGQMKRHDRKDPMHFKYGTCTRASGATVRELHEPQGISSNVTA